MAGNFRSAGSPKNEQIELVTGSAALAAGAAAPKIFGLQVRERKGFRDGKRASQKRSAFGVFPRRGLRHERQVDRRVSVARRFEDGRSICAGEGSRCSENLSSRDVT